MFPLARTLRAAAPLALLALAVAVPANAAAATLTATTTADAYVDEATPSNKLGAGPKLYVKGGSALDQIAYLKFSVPALDGMLESARLRVHVTGGSVDGPSVHSVASSWTETSLTWSAKPAPSSTVVADAGQIGTGWFEYDVTSAVRASGDLSFALRSGSTDGTAIASRESGDAAQLVITTKPAVPGASNTGVPAGTTLRVVKANQQVPGTSLRTDAKGDLVITTPNVVIDAVDLYGQIRVKAANVTIRRSVVRGPADGGTYNSALIDANDAAVANLLVEDALLVPQKPSYWLNGMIGHDYTARRINTYNVVDGFGVYQKNGDKKNANVTIEASYVHDLAWFSQDKDHSDGTHNDGIQVQGGANIRIVGNNIQAFNSTTAGTPRDPAFRRQASQGILVQQGLSPVTNIVIENNLVDGGLASIKVTNLSANGDYSKPITVTVQRNRLGRDQFDYGNGSKYPVRLYSKSLVNIPGLLTNAWADTGAALAVGRDTGIRYDYA